MVLEGVQRSLLEDSFVVLDVETRRSAQEVGGWGSIRLMGVSLAVVYDSRTNDFTWYTQEETPALARQVASAGVVVGFNTLRFDYTVLQPHAPEVHFSRLNSIDILHHLHAALGFRVSLESVTTATLGAPKSADGLQALRWWKEGKTQEIGEYCQQDVALTRDIYLYGKEHGFVRYMRKNGTVATVPALW